MIGRIEFESGQFKPIKPYKKGVYVKPSFSEQYGWLSKALDSAAIKHKVINLDDNKDRQKDLRLGSTIMVNYLGFRYQLIWVWIPRQALKSSKAGKWGLEIFKKRTGFQKLLRIKQLNERDPLIRTILDAMQGDGFNHITFVPERAFIVQS